MSDEGEVGEEEGLVIPALEVRVPPEWQSKMSTRALSSVTPTETPELAAACANIIEGKVKADAAGEESTTIAEFGWKWLEAQHGSHKLAEAALASLVSGVESSWQQSPVVRLFGELCGMLSDEYSESVTKRVLGLLRDAEADDEGEESSGVALIELPAISTTLLGEGDVGTVALAQAVAALPRLQLPEERQQALEAELQAASASGPPTVRLDATLLAAVGACRAELGQQTEVGEEMSEEQQAAAAQAAAEAAAPAPPAEVVESEEEAEGGAASSSGVNWEVLAAKLPTTRPELAACQALFALFDPAANGYLTRQEAEAGILETLGVEGGDEHGSAVSGAVGRGFDAAKQQAAEAGAEGGGDGEKLVVDGFRPLLLYVRRHLELLAAHPAGAQPEATLSAAELPRLAPRLARWGLADPAALLASLDDGSGAASFEAFSDAALRQLLASEEPLEGDGAAEVVDGLAGEGGGGAPPDDPLGGGRRLGAHDPPLEPVPETTEKSSFGTTTFGDAGGGGGGALGGFGSVRSPRLLTLARALRAWP